MRHILCILLSAFGLTTGMTQHLHQIRGTVFCENKGICGVVVSDGKNCVQTDKQGNYSLNIDNESRFVFISTPSGYLTEIKENTIPLFYKPIDRSADKNYNFHLKKNPHDDLNHVFFAQADVQAIRPENLETYHTFLNDYQEELASYRNTDIFGIDCGDITGDNAQLFPPYIEAIKSLNIPVYRAIGNHDMDYNGRSFETSQHSFGSFFGPTCYSFNKGKVHYIILNNNFYIGREFYYIGYIDEKTFQWLEKDLSFLEEGTPLVIVMHIPTRLTEKQQPFQFDYNTLADQTVNAEAFHQLIKDHPTHIISGHMHYNLNICYNDKLMEHNTAAICGTWWCSDICLDGTPRGYGIYQVNGNQLIWKYKCIGKPDNYQARVYLPGASKEFPQAIIANVWNWDKLWKVEWMEDGKLMGEMTQYTAYDPLAEKMCQEAVQTYSWIAPVKTNHLFKAIPQNPQAQISVKITDRFGHEYIQSAQDFSSFFLQYQK